MKVGREGIVLGLQLVGKDCVGFVQGGHVDGRKEGRRMEAIDRAKFKKLSARSAKNLF